MFGGPAFSRSCRKSSKIEGREEEAWRRPKSGAAYDRDIDRRHLERRTPRGIVTYI